MKWCWPISQDGQTEYVCLLLFADNYWIIAMSVQELQKANAYWQQCLEEAGWHTPAKDLRYCTTLFDDQFTKSSVTYGGEVVSRGPRKLALRL